MFTESHACNWRVLNISLSPARSAGINMQFYRVVWTTMFLLKGIFGFHFSGQEGRSQLHSHVSLGNRGLRRCAQNCLLNPDFAIEAAERMPLALWLS